MSYISYKLYRILSIPRFIILGFECCYLGASAFTIGLYVILAFLGVIDFDFFQLFELWLPAVFLLLVIYFINNVPIPHALLYHQLKREYLMFNKKVYVPQNAKEVNPLSAWADMGFDGEFRSKYILFSFKASCHLKRMPQEEWEKYYFDMMMHLLTETNASSYTAAAQWCCMYAEKHGLKKSTSNKTSAKAHASYTQDTQNRQAQEQFNQQMQQEQNRQQEQAFEEANTRFNQDMQRQMQQDIDNMNRQAQEQFNQQMMQQQMNNHMF